MIAMSRRPAPAFVSRLKQAAARGFQVSLAVAAWSIMQASAGYSQSMMFPSQEQGTPVLRGTRGLNPQQGGVATYPLPRRHMNAVGKPCLDVGGFSRAQTLNANIYDHLIRTENSCSQRIQIKACYYKSTKCIDIDVPPYGKKESILGIFPAMKDFRFEFTETFK
jgi:hypothetical protein